MIIHNDLNQFTWVLQVAVHHGPWEALGGPLGPLGGPRGALGGALGGPLGDPWGHFGGPRGPLGGQWGPLGSPQTVKQTFKVKMCAWFWKSLSNFSKVAPKIEPIHTQNDHWKRLHNLLLVIDFGTNRIFFYPVFEKLDKPYFFQHCHFWHWFVPSTASTGLISSCGPPSVYIKLFALSRRTSMTCQKNSHLQTLWWKQPLSKKLKNSENFTASDIIVQSGF